MCVLFLAVMVVRCPGSTFRQAGSLPRLPFLHITGCCAHHPMTGHAQLLLCVELDDLVMQREFTTRENSAISLSSTNSFLREVQHTA